jgi:type II secretory pathway pseudopilin PulG
MKARMYMKKNAESGYSLVEVILYMTLFAMLSTVLIGSLFGMSRSYKSARVTNDLLDSSQVSIERMTREIRGAVSLDMTSSVFTSDPGVLKLNTTDSGGTPKTVQFNISGANTLELTDSTDGTPRDLTGENVAVTSLVFRNITTTAGSAVRIEMTLESTRAPGGKTLSLTDTAALRGSY